MMLRMEYCQSRVADVNAGQTVVDACERANILAAGAIRRPLRDSLLTAARVPLPRGTPGLSYVRGSGPARGNHPAPAIGARAPLHDGERLDPRDRVTPSCAPCP